MEADPAYQCNCMNLLKPQVFISFEITHKLNLINTSNKD